eukprot:PRCOL_00000199-RA
MSGVLTTAEACPFCRDYEGCRGICRNPQNVDSAAAREVVAGETAVEAVLKQLEALAAPNEPKVGNWARVCYLFVHPTQRDPFERSRLFGVSKDIYQEDHFLGAFGAQAAGLVGLESFELVAERPLSDGRVRVDARVVEAMGRGEWVWTFVMAPVEVGKYAGLYGTLRLLREDSKWLEAMAS